MLPERGPVTKGSIRRIEGSLPVLEDRGIFIFKWSDAEKSFNWALASLRAVRHGAHPDPQFGSGNRASGLLGLVQENLIRLVPPRFPEVKRFERARRI